MPQHFDRPVPPDFEAVFIEIGRLDCQDHYHARRETITRWLDALGKQRLIDARAAYVAEQRAAGKWLTRQTCLVEKRVNRKEMGAILAEAFSAETDVDPNIARLAAQHLRVVRNGGFKISPMMCGQWCVGLRRMSSAELIALAVSRGFDPQFAEPSAAIFEGGPDERSAA